MFFFHVPLKPIENLQAACVRLWTNDARVWFLRSPCTWHDEGCGVTGVRRSPSNGTYLSEQVPWLWSVEAGNTMHRQHAFDSMQIPASRILSAGILSALREFSRLCSKSFKAFSSPHLYFCLTYIKHLNLERNLRR